MNLEHYFQSCFFLASEGFEQSDERMLVRKSRSSINCLAHQKKHRFIGSQQWINYQFTIDMGRWELLENWQKKKLSTKNDAQPHCQHIKIPTETAFMRRSDTHQEAYILWEKNVHNLSSQDKETFYLWRQNHWNIIEFILDRCPFKTASKCLFVDLNSNSKKKRR